MIRYRIRRMRPVMFLLAALSALAILAKPAPAHDIPSEIILHGYAKPIDNRLHFLVRIHAG